MDGYQGSVRGRLSVGAIVARHEALSAFVVASLLIFIVHQVKNVADFPWDSGDYWDLSQFSTLVDFPKQIRGIIYPALLLPFRLIEDTFPILGHMPFRFGSSLIYAWALTVVLPGIYTQAFGGKATFLRRLIVPALVCLIYPGLLIYPLSDLPAFLLASLAAWCLMLASKGQSRLRYVLLLLAGASAYAAYNTRNIYIIAFALLIVSILAVLFAAEMFGRRLIYTAVFLAGAAVASLPQANANLRNYGIATPLVQTVQADRKISLFAYQLLWGLTLQRYETSIDPTSPSPGLFYMDKAGEKFFADANVEGETFSVSKYLRLAITHPLQVAGILGRHFINGLDVRDGLVYTEELSSNKTVLALFNFTVVFLGAAAIIRAISAHPSWTAKRTRSAFWAVYFLAPVAMILPGAVETRFFIPLHLAFYAAIAFQTGIGFWATARRHWLVLAAAYVASATIFFSMSLSTMASMQYTYADQYRGPK